VRTAVAGGGLADIGRVPHHAPFDPGAGEKAERAGLQLQRPIGHLDRGAPGGLGGGVGLGPARGLSEPEPLLGADGQALEEGGQIGHGHVEHPQAA
jgi:hypothetical protein